MYTVENSKHFTPWTNPQNGVVSYVLTTEVAPFTQTFYFVSPSSTKDGRYFWFYCAFPPNGLEEGSVKTLARIDFETDEIMHFPQIQPKGSPLVDEDTGEVYWCTSSMILKRGPGKDDEIKLVCKPNLKHLVVANTKSASLGSGRIAGHLTFNHNKTKLIIEPAGKDCSCLGTVDLASGEVELWTDIMPGGWTHAQANPTQPDTILYAMDYWSESRTGMRHIIDFDDNGKLMRSWVLRKGGEPQLIKPMYIESSHEWWSADGKKVFYCDWIKGIVRHNLETGKDDLVMPYGSRHGYATEDEKYYAGDVFLSLDGKGWFRGCSMQVRFYNSVTDKVIDIITQSPELYTRDEACVYHIDAHPRFVMGDRYVAYTTTALGCVGVAFTKLDYLKELTGE